MIPARRNDIFLVNVATDRWGDLLDELEEAVEAHDSVQPLPHVVANRHWQLSLPPKTSQLGQRLHRLRLRVEGRVYNTLKEVVQQDSEHLVADYEDLYTSDEELFSMSFVPESAPSVSIPRVDVAAFECGHLILDVPCSEITRQLPHLIQPHPGTHPQRLVVSHPSDDDYATLKSLAIR